MRRNIIESSDFILILTRQDPPKYGVLLALKFIRYCGLKQHYQSRLHTIVFYFSLPLMHDAAVILAADNFSVANYCNEN